MPKPRTAPRLFGKRLPKSLEAPDLWFFQVGPALLYIKCAVRWYVYWEGGPGKGHATLEKAERHAEEKLVALYIVLGRRIKMGAGAAGQKPRRRTTGSTPS